MRLLAAIACALVAGCELFIEIPDPVVSTDAPPGSCVESFACMAPTPICDTAADMCVECLLNTDCPMERPTCDAHVCRACRVDADCDAGVCLDDGTCAASSRILHASPTGTGTACTMAEPCTIDQAVLTLSATFDVIKLAPGTYLRFDDLSIASNAYIAGSGATIVNDPARVGNYMFFFSAGSTVTVRDLTMSLDGFIGISCQAGGKLTLDRVTMQNGVAGGFSSCDLVIKRSRIIGNQFYGLSIGTGPIAITNSIFANNGNATNGNGAMILSNVASGTIEHTTIAYNSAQTAATSFKAIRCSMSPNVMIKNSIFWGHQATSIDPMCNVNYSIVDGYAGAGMNNDAFDPMFVQIGVDYHLQPTSPAKGGTDPMSMGVTVDFDGDARPNPAGSLPDRGADEIP